MELTKKDDGKDDKHIKNLIRKNPKKKEDF